MMTAMAGALSLNLSAGPSDAYFSRVRNQDGGPLSLMLIQSAYQPATSLFSCRYLKETSGWSTVRFSCTHAGTHVIYSIY